MIISGDGEVVARKYYFTSDKIQELLWESSFLKEHLHSLEWEITTINGKFNKILIAKNDLFNYSYD